MKSYHLSFAHEVQSAEVELPASKSISNRLLILQHLYQYTHSPLLSNFSVSNDTVVMRQALNRIAQNESTINVEDCGTAMRFLVSVLAITEGDWFLYGTHRMHARTLAPLINALRQLGADIECIEQEGYAPLRIQGKKLSGGTVKVDATISSQFISSLMMIAPMLEQGLTLELEGTVASQPYIQLTYELMHIYGVDMTHGQVVSIRGETLLLPSKQTQMPKEYRVESDWSAASYIYAWVALSPIGTNIKVNGLSVQSLQGDKECIDLFTYFGVETIETATGVELLKANKTVDELVFDFSQVPDLVPAVAVTCAGLSVKANLKGLQNLKHKETDRLSALANELNKVFPQSASIHNGDSLVIRANSRQKFVTEPSLETYNDHRIAMSFSVLSRYFPIEIRDPQVVSKSFPDWWIQLQRLGVSIKVDGGE